MAKLRQNIDYASHIREYMNKPHEQNVRAAFIILRLLNPIPELPDGNHYRGYLRFPQYYQPSDIYAA